MRLGFAALGITVKMERQTEMRERRDAWCVFIRRNFNTRVSISIIIY